MPTTHTKEVGVASGLSFFLVGLVILFDLILALPLSMLITQNGGFIRGWHLIGWGFFTGL
jgi:hypothetical protein